MPFIELYAKQTQISYDCINHLQTTLILVSLKIQKHINKQLYCVGHIEVLKRNDWLWYS